MNKCGTNCLTNSQESVRVRVANGCHQLKKIRTFRELQYRELYPEVSGFENDPFDGHAAVFFTQCGCGEVTSTARLVFDGALGLPEDNLIQNLLVDQRRCGLKIAELGRFIIAPAARGLLRDYYRAFYLTAVSQGVDAIVMVMKQKDVSLHQRKMGVRILAASLGVTFGSRHNYACVEWQIDKTKPAFFAWCGLDRATGQGEPQS